MKVYRIDGYMTRMQRDNIRDRRRRRMGLVGAGLILFCVAAGVYYVVSG